MTARVANSNSRLPELDIIDPLRLQDCRIPERRWIADGLIPHGQTTLLTGDGGVGKSLLAMQLLTACATGRPWIGHVAKRCKAIGIFCEDDEDELTRRQAAINRAFGIDFGDLEDMLWVPRIGRDNALMEFERYEAAGQPMELFQQVHDAASNFGAQVVVLDALHDFFTGNENNRTHARQFIQLLTSLARDIDGAVLLCAHPSVYGLQSGSGTSGSTAWNNAVRSRLYLKDPDLDHNEDADPNQRILETKKANYGPKGDGIDLEWRQGVFVPTNLTGDAVNSIKLGLAEKAFLDCLDALERQKRRVSESKNSSTYAPKVMTRMPEHGNCRLRELERAMNRLFSTGKITNEEYGPPSKRSTRIAHVKIEVEA